jgi:hypothetical protein
MGRVLSGDAMHGNLKGRNMGIRTLGDRTRSGAAGGR